MHAATFMMHPKELADILANAVDIGKDRTTRPLIFLAASGDTLHVYGRGRYAAGRDSRPFTADTPQYGEIVITEDEASELATALRALEGAGRKGTTVDVELAERGRFVIGQGTICDLPDADPEQATFGMPDELNDWEEIDLLLMEILKGGQEPVTRLAFQKDILARINKIRADSPVMDIALHPTGHAVGIALGSTFRALIAGVSREQFAIGGKWGNGPGKPEHLWEA